MTSVIGSFEVRFEFGAALRGRLLSARHRPFAQINAALTKAANRNFLEDVTIYFPSTGDEDDSLTRASLTRGSAGDPNSRNFCKAFTDPALSPFFSKAELKR